MIKIKNPYTKKRFNLKEKSQKKFSETVIPWIKKIPLNEDWDAKRRFIPQSLNRIRIDLEHKHRSLWKNNVPEDTGVSLLSMYVAEYIPIEYIDNLNKGLKKIFREFNPTGFNTNNPSNIDKFCSEVKQSIHGRRWSRFGDLQIHENNELCEFVNRISVNGTQISSSSIVIQFVIEPSDKFQKEYNKLIESNIEEEPIFVPKIKQLFSFWASKSRSNVIVKEQMIEDLLLELKWRTLKEMGKYFYMYFYKNKLVPPSIEVYKIKQRSCRYKYDENEERSEFWDSIGMSAFRFHEISKNGHWQLFANEKEYLIDNSIKLACNEEIPQNDIFSSLNFQIVYFVKELAMSLLPILVMRYYTIALGKKIADQQKNTFKSIKKENPNYNKLINIRYELEQNLQILKRFKNEMEENEFKWIKGRIIGFFSDFDKARPTLSEISWGEWIMDNTNFLIKKTDTLSQNFVKIIDDTVRLIEIKTNNSLRKRTFWLTVFTGILSILATLIAAISLYFQFSKENQQKVQEFLLPLIKLFM
ncbi:hypothetical protein P4689_20470 [Priestia megaterium]|uniref:hypothetical protein n=2 Tax=Priestia megaterium TaxID=1404 RepID=UPI002E1E88F7|nr:hypothetical protein [Priestia megaterium]